MTDAPTTDGSYLTLSEERLTVGPEVLPVRRAVLRVETTSAQVMVPVTVTRQHVRIEYVDVDPDTAGQVDPDRLPEGRSGGWVVLTADEPVVTTRPVPVERVRLVTSWATAEQDMTTQLAHEDIAFEILPAQTAGRPPTS